MATYSYNPLSIEEMQDLRKTMLAMEKEIHHPGASRSRGHDLLPDIEDALYRLLDAIERVHEVAS